ncbi:hypothetical protein CDAR_542521 [Caerostris darwini]|uniref:Uncharacterized protein n=1 Tax=Caerostris darwini TaxID=1538125 RepID=A0AAV4RRM6_9ARAC|nr:hypothetical protein CDAR_542521 [Caerostris darwini]
MTADSPLPRKRKGKHGRFSQTKAAWLMACSELSSPCWKFDKGCRTERVRFNANNEQIKLSASTFFCLDRREERESGTNLPLEDCV